MSVILTETEKEALNRDGFIMRAGRRYEMFEGKLRRVLNGGRSGWWRFNEHYDRDITVTTLDEATNVTTPPAGRARQRTFKVPIRVNVAPVQTYTKTPTVRATTRAEAAELVRNQHGGGDVLGIAIKLRRMEGGG